MDSIPGSVIRSSFRNEPVSFFVENEYDVIQGCHNSGEFYEIEELLIIEKYFPRGGVFLDLGSNIGNHTIFACKFLGAAMSIVVEPIPTTARLLEINIEINRLTGYVDMTLLGVGFSDAEGSANAIVSEENRGASWFSYSDEGEIKLVRGDDVLAGRKIDFIKLDVEGMEIAALDGLTKTINDNRPVIFAEIGNNNLESFLEFVQALGYSIKDRYRRYESVENYLIVPSEKFPD